MKKLISMLSILVIALPIMLVGCSKKSTEPNIIGTWVYSYSDSRHEDDDNKGTYNWTTHEHIVEYQQSSYTFNKNKTASFSYPSNPEKNDNDLTWKVSDNKIILTDKDDHEKTFELKNNYLIELDYHDGELIEKHYYEKQ